MFNKLKEIQEVADLPKSEQIIAKIKQIDVKFVASKIENLME